MGCVLVASAEGLGGGDCVCVCVVRREAAVAILRKSCDTVRDDSAVVG